MKTIIHQVGEKLVHRRSHVRPGIARKKPIARVLFAENAPVWLCILPKAIE